MSPPLPLPFPGSQTVSAWWHELAPHRPLRLWLSHLLLHRVEALTEVDRPCHLNGLHLEVLRAVSGGHRLAGLDPAFSASLTRELIDGGFLTGTGPDLKLTDAGRGAVAGGCVGSFERRTFYFLDNRSVERPHHLVRLHRAGTPISPAEPWEFDREALQDAAAKDAEWKARFGFPAGVIRLQLPSPNNGDWRSVILDRPEHLFVAVVEVKQNAEESCLLGFAARVDGWALEPRSPVLDLGRGWQEAMPDLAAEPSEEEWRAAWLARADQKGIPRTDAAACRLEPSAPLLRVHAATISLARLRGSGAGSSFGEEWMLAGQGRSRAAARVELVPC
jgi:hypothetical protein